MFWKNCRLLISVSEMESTSRITEPTTERYVSASSNAESDKVSEKEVFIPEPTSPPKLSSSSQSTSKSVKKTPKTSEKSIGSTVQMSVQNIHPQNNYPIKADSITYTDAQKLSIQEDYLRVFNRYSRKRKIYTATAQYFKKLDSILIVFPMILIQMVAAILPIYMKSNELVSTVLASVTAALIGAQAKLHWSSTSDKFQTVATMYSNLADQCYYQYLECSKDLKQFLQNANEIERASRQNCPPPPIWIENQYKKERSMSSLDK